MRHIRHLKRAYLNDGAKGLINKKRGKASNRKLPNALKELSIALINEHYSDFKPTFATEKLVEIHGLKERSHTLMQQKNILKLMVNLLHFIAINTQHFELTKKVI